MLWKLSIRYRQSNSGTPETDLAFEYFRDRR